MYETNYLKANDVNDAASKMKKADDGKYLAGGQTLIPTMKARLAAPSDLIDLGGISNLKNSYVTLLSIYDLHCSFDYDRNFVEWPKIGHMLQLMYEGEGVTSQPKYDHNWQRVSDHMVQVFSCLTGHGNLSNGNIFSLTGKM